MTIQPNLGEHPVPPAAESHTINTPSRRRMAIPALLGIFAVSFGLGIAMFLGVIRNPLHATKPSHAEKSDPGRDFRPVVEVITPIRVASQPIVVEQLAMVEPYYRADLRARASGIVRRVYKDIGEKVKEGEILIEIDVPELDQDVARAEAMVGQREQELRVSQAKLKDAQAAREVSAATIRQREADVLSFTATRDLRKRKWERFKDLAAKGSVVGSVVEEEERDYLASEAALTSAKANVERARADYSESESKVEAAAADIELKRAQIQVALRELDRARAVQGYSRVTAPFDGVIVRRNVDPGSFVQNATSGSSEPLISISRLDIVTVSARFPDNAAPLIADDTPAFVSIDEMPGVKIATKISRHSPSVQNSDHTMRVEVDLFNGSDDEYANLFLNTYLFGGGGQMKGSNTPIPERAFPQDDKSKRRLIPGMTGNMMLILGGYGESYVIPSSAIYSRSGNRYVLLVEDGRTRQVQVRVQINDGKMARVALVSRSADAFGGAEILTDLTGREQIVAAKQLEIGNGTDVRVAPLKQ